MELGGRSLFVEVFPVRPRLVVVGAVEVARSLVRLAKELGFETVVIDGRASFATPERFPDVDRLVVGWPDEVADEIGLGPNDAVAVLTHDVKFDEPAIVEALRRGCRYVGAVGSRKTQGDRRERLLEAGVTADELARLRGPVGPGPGRPRAVGDRPGDPGRGRGPALRRHGRAHEGACRRVTDRAAGVVAIVLAAGAGSRFGGRKLLAPIEGRPVLQHVLDRVAAAGIERVVVVLGADARELQAAITWRDEVRVVNPEPERGLSSSLRVGMAALPRRRRGGPASCSATSHASRSRPSRRSWRLGVDDERPIAVPVYADDRGRNPVLLGRAAFALVEAAEGDRGLGPVIAAHPELVREVPVPGADAEAGNPDVDTRADHVRLLTTAWAARVRANAEQVDRVREVPDGADFYAPVTGLFRADPTRTDEPALDALLANVRAGETWLDIGAGAGRYALPVARALAASGGRVIAVDPSRGMLDGLREIAATHGIDNVEVVEARWPPAHIDAARFTADVSLIAHVGYDIEAIGPFISAMEGATDRRCVAMLMERQPSSIADVCWPTVWGEERIALPALPEFVELLRAMGRDVEVLRISREPRRFASRDELAGFLRRQLWVADGSAADRRFQAAVDDVIEEDADGRVGLRGQRPLPIGIATWAPGSAA